ncbi:MAG: glycosyl transferase [Verrucomicrobiaceae bacterium]|nr:glycosyl transferase [Verrucomicrobiaceae bacterium]
MTIIVLMMCVLSLLMVGAYRLIAIKYRWLDQPNQRSSHSAIIPRGAGLVFALLITVSPAIFAIRNNVLWMSLVAVFAVALIGWWDDLRGLSARYRFALYWLCAVSTTLIVYNASNLVTRPTVELLVLLVIISVALLWLINLYNFMDGINGLAGVEALYVIGSALWLGQDSEFFNQTQPLLSITCAVITGFLVWNFPKAKVFMGDAGSAYIGALVGLAILWSQLWQGPSLFSWLILLGVFIVDTTYTLILRIWTRQRWYAAHRVHAYQRLSDIVSSHTRTVLLLSTVNILWLLPFAWLARNGGALGWAAITVAYIPLIVACQRLKAGIPPTPSL